MIISIWGFNSDGSTIGSAIAKTHSIRCRQQKPIHITANNKPFIGSGACVCVCLSANTKKKDNKTRMHVCGRQCMSVSECVRRVYGDSVFEASGNVERSLIYQGFGVFHCHQLCKCHCVDVAWRRGYTTNTKCEHLVRRGLRPLACSYRWWYASAASASRCCRQTPCPTLNGVHTSNESKLNILYIYVEFEGDPDTTGCQFDDDLF